VVIPLREENERVSPDSGEAHGLMIGYKFMKIQWSPNPFSWTTEENVSRTWMDSSLCWGDFAPHGFCCRKGWILFHINKNIFIFIYYIFYKI